MDDRNWWSCRYLKSDETHDPDILHGIWVAIKANIYEKCPGWKMWQITISFKDKSLRTGPIDDHRLWIEWNSQRKLGYSYTL